MSRERLLTIAVVVLLLLNLGVLTYFLIGQRLGPPRPELSDVLVRELEMTRDQQEHYFSLRDQHRSQMDQLNGRFASTLENYLQLIEEDSVSEKRNQLESKMATIEKEKASATLEHFKAVKNLCIPQQREKFTTLIPEIARHMSRPRMNRPSRRD